MVQAKRVTPRRAVRLMIETCLRSLTLSSEAINDEIPWDASAAVAMVAQRW